MPVEQISRQIHNHLVLMPILDNYWRTWRVRQWSLIVVAIMSHLDCEKCEKSFCYWSGTVRFIRAYTFLKSLLAILNSDFVTFCKVGDQGSLSRFIKQSLDWCSSRLQLFSCWENVENPPDTLCGQFAFSGNSVSSYVTFNWSVCYLYHGQTIRTISGHPTQSNLKFSASEWTFIVS